MRLGLCLLLLLPMVGACATAAPPPTDPFGRSLYQRDTEVYDPTDDYFQLRRYDQQEHDADPKVLAAARRVLGGIRFGEITQAELERRLGTPYDSYGLNGRRMVEFLYDNESDGVAARFEVYEDKQGVLRVLELESTGGLGRMTGGEDDDEGFDEP